jgi:transposase
LLRAGLNVRDRHAAAEISRHGLAVAGGHLENQLADLVFPQKTNAANVRLAQHLWGHRNDLFTFLGQPGLDATNWRAELALHFGVILRKVWGGSRTWPGARAQSVLMSVWRTCWQQGRSALEFLSQLLRSGQFQQEFQPNRRQAHESVSGLPELATTVGRGSIRGCLRTPANTDLESGQHRIQEFSSALRVRPLTILP